MCIRRHCPSEEQDLLFHLAYEVRLFHAKPAPGLASLPREKEYTYLNSAYRRGGWVKLPSRRTYRSYTYLLGYCTYLDTYRTYHYSCCTYLYLQVHLHDICLLYTSDAADE